MLLLADDPGLADQRRESGAAFRPLPGEALLAHCLGLPAAAGSAVAWLLSATVLGNAILQLALQYRLNYLGRDFFNAFQPQGRCCSR